MNLIYQMAVYSPTFVSLLWAVVLLLEQRLKNPAKYFLGYFMLAAALVYFSHAVYFAQYYRLYLYVDPIYNLASLSVYPLFYWYVKLLTEETSYDFRNIKHLIPALFISSSTALIYMIMDKPEQFVKIILFKQGEVSDVFTRLWNLQKGILVFSRIIFFIQVIVYLYLGLKRIEKYRKSVSNFYSDLEGRDLEWVKWLIVVFSITAFASAVANFVGRCYFLNEFALLTIPALVFSVLLFIIGYLGLKQNHTIKEFKTDESDNNLQEPVSHFGSLKKQLILLFEEEKVYIRSDLRVNQLGQMLNTNRTYISKLINDEFNCSFSDFVNKYRIEEAKKMLSSHQASLYTLEHVARISGFTSTGSFIRIFKQHEGITPGVYKKRIN